MSSGNSTSQGNSTQLLTLLEGLMQSHQIEPTEAMLQVYTLALGDLSPEQVQTAVMRAIREVPRMPRPAELRELAGVSVAEDTKAMQAWGDVQKAIPIGKWKWIDFRDQRINATIRNLCSGGWPDFLERMDGGEKEKWARLEFMKAYTKIGDDLSAEQCRPLVGLGEKTCIGGQMRDPIVRIECRNPERQTAIEHRRAEPVTLRIASFRRAD
jgi:hypothetical protein